MNDKRKTYKRKWMQAARALQKQKYHGSIPDQDDSPESSLHNYAEQSCITNYESCNENTAVEQTNNLELSLNLESESEWDLIDQHIIIESDFEDEIENIDCEAAICEDLVKWVNENNISHNARSLERGSSRSPASRRSRSPASRRSRSPVRRRQPRILPDLETDNSRRSHSSGDQVLMTLIRIENTVNENNEMLKRLVNKNTGNYGDMDLEDLVPVPIQDDLEWEEFQTRLKNTDFSKKLVHFLAVLGGNKIGDTVRKICRRLALNNQWSKFSLKGKNKKKSLQAEVLHKVIIKACTRVHKNAKESEVDEAISDFLRHAPHQPGGTRYKKPTQTASTTVPDPATAQAGEYQAATESD